MWICRAKASDMSGWRGQNYNEKYLVEHFKEGSMSGVLWCDVGEHPFSMKDKNRQHFVNTHQVEVYTGNNYGNPNYQPRQEVTEEIDICGEHWMQNNPMKAPEVSAIDVAESEAEESAAEMWEAKYRADHAELARLKRQAKN